MARSVKKGPFVDGHLQKKADVANENKDRRVIRLTVFITAEGNPATMPAKMIKLGEFSPTRTFFGHAADKKSKGK
jgi:small subunit ribosomal protein S19